MKHSIAGKDLYSWKQWATQLAQENDVETSEIDWLLQGLTALSSLSLRLGDYKEQENIPSKATLLTLTEKWQQRINSRIPVQYLAGEMPWRNFLITVTPDVLIPRPETELIIDIAKELVGQSLIKEHLLKGHWADLGTGSGAIALALAHQFPQATIHAVDISKKAIAIAQLNAQQNGMGNGTTFQRNRITFYIGSWLSPLNDLKGQLSAIVSNPPYIPSRTVLTLQPEITNHEPHIALDGGPDGLDCIRTLIATSQTYLHPGGLWLIELMQGQAETVAALLTQQGYDHIAIHPDLSGIQRFVVARKAL